MECPVCGKAAARQLCAACVRHRVGARRAQLDAARLSTAQRAHEAHGAAAAHAAAAYKARAKVELEIAAQRAAEQAAAARSALARQRSALRTRQARLRARRARLAKAREALAAVHELMVGEDGIACVMLHGLSMQLEELLDHVALERKRRVMQLVELFPLETGGPHETIAKLRLPGKELRGMGADERSAAIAIVVRVLSVASSYLSLPLPFRMESLGCKASIGRWGDQPTPLEGTGLALESGMIMLRKNVEALCFYQGLPAELTRDWTLLHALWQLFHSPSLGSSVQQSLVAADSRVGRVPAGRSLRPRPRVEGPPPLPMDELHDEDEDEDEEGFRDGLVVGLEAAAAAVAADDWDLLERPQPPKPSRDEDIAHWLSSGAGGGR